MSERSAVEDGIFYLSLANYAVLVVLFAVIVSDACGQPQWYHERLHPPVTPDGRLQYVSEHIMRCKYSEDAAMRVLPWAVVYSFALLLVQATHTWIMLHMVEAQQICRLHHAGAQAHVVTHTLFSALALVTLAGMLMVVEFDHDYLPDVRAGQATITVWTDLSHVHAAGVLLLVSGFLLMHLMVLGAYLLRVQSFHDFVHMCAGCGDPWALSKPLESPVWPRVRRGTYIGGNVLLGATFGVFMLVFWLDLTIVVATEYVLLGMVVVVSVVNLSISRHIALVYGVR